MQLKSAHMKRYQSLEEVDRQILDIISHYGSLVFQDLWWEIGKEDTLKEQMPTREKAQIKLEFLEAQGFVKRIEPEGISHWTLRK